MNVLLLNDPHPVEKTAVRLLIFLLVIAVFSGEGMYMNGRSEAGQLKTSTGSVLSADTESFKGDVKELRKKLWGMSLQRRYGKVYYSYPAEGIVHIKLTKYINRQPVKLNVIEVNRGINPDIEIMPVTAKSTLAGRAGILNISGKNNSTAAVNGSFFKPQTGVPLGIMMIDGKMLTGPIYDRAALGIFEDGFKIDRVSLNAAVTFEGRRLRIDGINRPRMLSTETIVYTKDWGQISPPTPKYGIRISVEQGKIITISNGSVPIPEKGFVISGPKDKTESFFNTQNSERKIIRKRHLNEIALDIGTLPEWKGVKHIIGGGPFLVKNGEIFVDAIDEKFKAITGRNPRTAVGFTEEGNFIMLTIDGREERSVGAGLYDTAKIMKQLGCKYAMNLDGGGSSVMQVNGKIVNNPSVKGGIAISNALTVNIPAKIATK